MRSHCRKGGLWTERLTSPGDMMNAYQAFGGSRRAPIIRSCCSLRRHGAGACHHLHYLQMVTEKLGKAYFSANGKPREKSHASFVRFLQALDDRQEPVRTRIAELFGFGRSQDFENCNSLRLLH